MTEYRLSPILVLGRARSNYFVGKADQMDQKKICVLVSRIRLISHATLIAVGIPHSAPIKCFCSKSQPLSTHLLLRVALPSRYMGRSLATVREGKLSVFHCTTHSSRPATSHAFFFERRCPASFLFLSLSCCAYSLHSTHSHLNKFEEQGRSCGLLGFASRRSFSLKKKRRQKRTEKANYLRQARRILHK